MNKDTEVKSTHELIGLLLYDDEKKFKEKFRDLLQSITDLNSLPYQTDSNVHDEGSYRLRSPEFFTYLILGSILVLPYTELMADLNIESIYIRPVKDDDKIKAVDLCIITNRDGKKEARALTFTINSTGENKVFTLIGEMAHTASRNFDKYLMEILQQNKLDQKRIRIDKFEVSVSVGDRVALVHNKNELSIGNRRIKKYQIGKDFSKVEKSNNNVNNVDEQLKSFNTMTLDEKQDLSTKIIDRIFSIFNSNAKVFELSRSRITYQAFAYGAIMFNLKGRGKVSCFVNSILGKDYADLIFTINHRSISGAIPTVVKFGEGTGQYVMGKMKGKGYHIAPLQLKPMVGNRILIGVNFSENQQIESEIVNVSQQKNFFNQNYGSKLDLKVSREDIESFIKNTYYSIVDFIPSKQNEPTFDQKYKNYFSRLVLGQLLASNLHQDIKKWVFTHDDDSLNKKVTTFALKTSEKVIILNIIEDTGHLLKITYPYGNTKECVVINIKIDPRNAEYGFNPTSQEKRYLQELTIEENPVDSKEKGRWILINKNINLQTLSEREVESKKRQADVETKIFLKLGNFISDVKSFINNEPDFQALMQGIFTGVPNIVPLVELNYGPEGRPDLALQHTDTEVPLIVIEEKFYPGYDAEEGKDKLRSAVVQIEKSKRYKAFTNANKAIKLAVQFNKHIGKTISYKFAEEEDIAFSSESDDSIFSRLLEYTEKGLYDDLKRHNIEDYVNKKKHGKALLHVAVDRDKKEIVDYLLETKYVNIDIRDQDNSTPLHIAAQKGYMEIVQKLLKKGASLEITSNDDKTPLWVAVDNQDIDMATTLFDAGANPNLKNNDGTPILFEVIKSKNYAMTKLFLGKGAYFNIRNTEEKTVADFALEVANGSDVAKFLDKVRSAFRSVIYEKKVSNILKGFDAGEIQTVLDVVDMLHITLLSYAAQKGHENVVKELIEKGANVKTIDKSGMTPLHYAASAGYFNIVMQLIEAKADINIADNDGSTPLHQAARNNHKSVVETLLSREAITSIKDLYGYDPLHWAVMEDYQDVAELLIKNKADINVVYDDGFTPLSLAGEGGLENMAMLLIKNGAYIQPVWQAHYFKAQGQARHLIFTAVRLFEIINSDNPYEGIVKQYDNLQQKMEYEDEKIKVLFSAYDDKGRTLLHYAASQDNQEIIKFLVDKGVDVNIKDKDSNTALHVAAKTDHMGVVKLLLQKGAHFNVNNKKGEMPIDNSNGEVSKLLQNINDLFDYAKEGNYKKARAILYDLSRENIKIILNTYDNQGKAVLHYVAESNNKKIAELFINNGAYFNTQDSGSKTPLDLAPKDSSIYRLLQNINDLFGAVENGNYEEFSSILKILDQHGMNFDIFDNKGRTLLHYAAQNNNKEIVIQLIKGKISVNVKDDESKTPLDLAPENSEVRQLLQTINNVFENVKNGEYENTKQTLEGLSTDDIEAVLIAYDSEGKSCFQYAIEQGYSEIVELLISKRADVNAIFDNGETPLYTATKHGSLDIVKLLIDKEVNINGKCKNGNNALHAAAEQDRVNIVELLLKHGAKWYQKNNKHKTPLGFAPESSQTYKLLKGIDDLFDAAKSKDSNKAQGVLNNLSEEQIRVIINLVDDKGNTHFLQAVKNDSSDVAKLLIDSGANVNVKDSNKKTASYLVINEKHINVLKLLIEKKIFNFQYDDGLTALHLAAKSNDQNIASLLIEKRSDIENFSIDAQDNNGNTALHLAAREGHTNIIQLLIKEGASFNTKNNDRKVPLDFVLGDSESSILKNIKDMFNAAKNSNVRFMLTTLIKLKPEEKAIILSARDDEGKTLLHHAAEIDNAQLVTILINNGASINTKDNQNKTPLDLASEDSEAYALLQSIGNLFRGVENAEDQSVLETIKELELQGKLNVAVKATNNIGNTPLHIAAIYNSVNVASLLIKKGNADVSVKNRYGNTPLHAAAAEGHKDISGLLIKNGAYIDAINNGRNTPLDLAHEGSEAKQLLQNVQSIFSHIKEDNLSGTKSVVDRLSKEEVKIILNAKDSSGNTPLHYAADNTKKSDNVDLVELLIKYGAYFNVLNNKGKSTLGELNNAKKNPKALEFYEDAYLLSRMVEGKDLVMLQILQQRRDISNVAFLLTYINGNTLLIEACARGDNKNISGFLIERGKIDVNIQNNMGVSALYGAVQGGYKDIVELLIKNKAVVNMQNMNGDTPLHVAVEKGHKDIVELLIKNKADVNTQDMNGDASLHFAAENGHKNIVALLIKHGAYFNIKNKNDQLPMELAFKFKHNDIWQLLLKLNHIFYHIKGDEDDKYNNVESVLKGISDEDAKVIINAKDEGGNTALHYATKQNNGNLVKLLIKHRACFSITNSEEKTPLDLSSEGSEVKKWLGSIKNIFEAVNNNDDKSIENTLKMLSQEEVELIINAHDSDGGAYLHYAAVKGNINMAQLLISKGADVNVKDDSDYTPLHAVAIKGYVSIAELLIDSNAYIGAQDKDGYTPLHYSILFSKEEVVLLLMKKDPSLVSIKGNNGFTPLDLANDKLKESNTQEERKKYQKMINILSGKDVSAGAATACLPKASRKGKGRNRKLRDLGARVRRGAGNECLLMEDEEGKIDKEKTGIEVNEENLAESKIDRENLKAYQEDIKVRLADAVERGDEDDKSLIEKEQDQLNKLIVEIQQAQAIKNFYVLSKEIFSGGFDNKFNDVIERTNGEMISPESMQYFKQIIKINLLRTLVLLIGGENFKALLLSNPEKFSQDLLDGVFARVKEAVFEEYEGKEKLSYEDFENIESRINEQINGVEVEFENLINQDINKSHLSNYVLKSVGLSELLVDTDVSLDLKNKMSYEAIVTLGSLIADHENHIKANHHGHENNVHMDNLKNRVKESELLSIAHDVYKLSKNRGDISQSQLKSKVVKDKISLYGGISSEYVADDLFTQFSSEEIGGAFSKESLKSFDNELAAYGKEVITVHSRQVQVQTSHVAIGIKGSNDQNIIINGIEDIKNPDNFNIDEANFEIQLELQGKKYTVTSELEGGDVKFYLAIDGYQVKIGDLISSFSSEEKNNIHNKLNTLNDKVELLQQKKFIEEVAEYPDFDQDVDKRIDDIKQEFLKLGVKESTWEQLNRQLEDLNQEVYAKYIDGVGENLTKNNIAFDRSKFESAKIKGSKGGRFMSVLAIYDFIDSTTDLKGLGDNPVNTIFGINGLLDAMDDVRETISTQYTRPDGKVKTRLSRNGLGKITSKIPAGVRKGFVKLINNPGVQSITYVTIAYQFGYSIGQIVKGENVALNSYFATSSGIKFTSMSVNFGTRIAVSFGVKVTTSVALRGALLVAKFLARASIVTAIFDAGVKGHLELNEQRLKIQAVAAKIPISFAERFDVLVSPSKYKAIVKVSGYLNNVKMNGINLLEQDHNIAATVQYVTDIEEKYNQIIKIKSHEKTFITHDKNGGENYWKKYNTCKLEDKVYNVKYIVGSRLHKMGFLRSLQTLKLELYQLDDIGATRFKSNGTHTGKELYEIFCREQEKKKVYIVNSDYKYLPHITQDEYRDGIRFVSVPLGGVETVNSCSEVITDYDSDGPHCSVDKIYKDCKYTFTIRGESVIRGRLYAFPKVKPFIFTKLGNNQEGKIVYLPGPQSLTAAENYPAVMYLPKNDHYDKWSGNVWKGPENHESTFIVNDKSTLGLVIGGGAVAEKNMLVMNADVNEINVNLNNGQINYDAPVYKRVKFGQIDFPNILLSSVYNYISNTRAKQGIITDCKAKLVNAGGGSRGNTVRQAGIKCKDEDHEVRTVYKNDVHYRGSKKTIFIVSKDESNGATITVDDNFSTSKNNTDTINLQGVELEKLRIKEEQGYYNITLLPTDDGQSTNIKVDNFKNLIIGLEGNQAILVQDKSIGDLMNDAYYQKLNCSGEYVDDDILENRKIRSKAVILQEVDNVGVAKVAKDIINNSYNLGIPAQVIVTKHHDKELIEQAIIYDTYSKNIYVDLFASGDFKFDYPFSYVESIKTKNENTTIFSFFDGYKVHLNSNSHNADDYVFADTRSVSEVIAAGDYQDIVGELNTTVPIKIGDELVIIGTKGNDVLHNNPNYKTHLIGNGGSDKYVIDMNLNDFSIPEVVIYDSNRPAVDMYGLSSKLKDKFGKDPLLQLYESYLSKLRIRIEKGVLRENTIKSIIEYILKKGTLNDVTIGEVLKEDTLKDMMLDCGIEENDRDKLRIENNIQEKKIDDFLRDFLEKCVPKNSLHSVLEDISEKDYLTLTIKIEQCKGNSFFSPSTMQRRFRCKLNEELLTAAKGGDLSKVEHLITQDISLETQDDYSNTVLHLAAKNCHDNVVAYLLDNKNLNKIDIKINPKNKDGKTPLNLAEECELSREKDMIRDLFGRSQANLDFRLFSVISGNDLAQVRNFVGRGASLMASYGKGTSISMITSTPLHMAVFWHSGPEVVAYLVKSGANVEATNGVGDLPLHYACRSGGLDIVRYLIDINNEANLNTKNNGGDTPLHLAVFRKHLNVLKYLVGNGADVDVKNNDNKTPLDLAKVYMGNQTAEDLRKIHQLYLDKQLIVAAENGDLSKVKDLHSKGADINARDNYDMTPLHLATEGCHVDVVKYLLDQSDININVKNKNDETSIDLANGFSGIVQILEKAQLDLNKKLIIAAQNGDLNKVKDLHSKGADINAKGNCGTTPLHRAARFGHTEVVQYLVDNGADVNAKNCYLLTPSKQPNLNYEIIKILEKAQLDLDSSYNATGVVGDKVENTTQHPIRHRRHKNHHRVHHYKDSEKRKRRSIENNLIDESKNLEVEEPKISAMKNSGEKPKSWLNEGFELVKSSISWLFSSKTVLPEEISSTIGSTGSTLQSGTTKHKFKFREDISGSTSTTLPSDGIGVKSEKIPVASYRDKHSFTSHMNENLKHERQMPNTFESKSEDTILEMGDHYMPQVDGNGTMQLLDLIARKITGAKPLSFKNNDISESDARRYALDIIEALPQVIMHSANKSGISVKQLKHDSTKILDEVRGKIISGKLKDIPEVLSFHAMKALPQGLHSKQLGKFKAEFDKEMNARLNKLVGVPSNGHVSIIHKQRPTNTNKDTISSIPKYITNENNYKNVSGPKTGLNNVSITGNLTKVMGV